MMSHPFTIFYSWQSDLPASTNRTFIEDELKKAIGLLDKLEITFDRDTQNMSGSPDIREAILDKIAKADAFVCDVSIINQASTQPDAKTGNTKDSRLVPNPNVLLELGYAMRILPWERIILIVNEAYGSVETLPFDIKFKRALTYKLSFGEPKEATRKNFTKTLAHAIEMIHALGVRAEVREVVPTFTETVIQKLSDGKADAIQDVRGLWKHWLIQLDSMNPTFDSNSGDNISRRSELYKALENSLDLTREFGKFVNVIADNNFEQASQIIYDGFLPLIKRLDLPVKLNGSYADSDFFRFICHEWFLMFVAALIRSEKWRLLGQLLSRTFVFAPANQPVEQSFEWNVLNGKSRVAP